MKKTIALLTVLALCLSVLAGCGGQSAETKTDATPAPTPEPTPVDYTGEEVPRLSMVAKEASAVFSKVIVEPINYSWNWPGEDGIFQGMEACGAGPTDPLVPEYLDYAPLEESMTVELTWPDYPADSVSVECWEIGVYELPAEAPQAQVDGYARDARLTAYDWSGRWTMVLEPDRVYDVHAEWNKSEGRSFGDSHYFILTRNPNYTAPVLVGGWNIEGSTRITEDLGAAFETAVKDLTDVTYEPVACLGRQTVAGTNYALLSRARGTGKDAQPYYAVTVLYVDLEGNPSLRDAIPLTPWGEPDGNAPAGQPPAGGWSVLEDQEACQKAVEDATGHLLGTSYEIVWGLSSQVVAGRNYWALCRTRAVTPGAGKVYTLVKVYVDLNGNASVAETSEWDLVGIISSAEG